MNLSDENCDMADKMVNIDLERCQISSSEGVPAKKKKPKKKKAPNGSTGSGGTSGFIFSPDREKMLKISQLEGKGRCLVAKCVIGAGTCYYTERAVAVVAHNGGLCSQCTKHIKHNNSEPCTTDAKLPMERFCSSACLQMFCAEPAHYRYSQAVNDCIPQAAAASSCDKDLLRMVFNLLACFLFPSALTEREDAGAVCMDEAGVVRATRRGILSLETHMAHQSAAWIEAVHSGITAILDALDQQEIKLQLPGEAEGDEDTAAVVTDRAALMERALFLACTVNVNAYGILGHSDGAEGALGFGLFPAVGLCVNHSCDPNSYYARNPQTGCMEYRTLRDVRASEELTVSYVDVFQDTPQRRQSIAKTRFFLCGCSRCAGYDVAVKTTKAICAAPVTKLSKAETEANRRALSPFYLAPTESSADAWLDDEPTTAASSGGKAGKSSGKGKSKTAAPPAPASATAPASGGQQGSDAAAAGMDKDALRRVLADAALGGLHCEHCAGPQGVVLVVPGDAPATKPETTEGALAIDGGQAACLVCTTQVDWKSASASIERCRSQWQVCHDTVRFSPAGAPAVAHIEKFLQEADPEYVQYTTCSLLPTAAGTVASAAGAGQTAQAAAAERRRRQKCPVQLHGDHLLLGAAYALLAEHLSSLSTTAASAGQGAATPGSVQARTLYALRRVVRCKRAIFQPHLHPEVASVQLQLAQQLGTVARHCAKGTHAQKELLRECTDLLAEIGTSRSYAFGVDHALTLAARDMLTNMQR